MRHPWNVEEVNCIATVCCCFRDLHALNQESISDQTLDAAAVSGHQVVFLSCFIYQIYFIYALSKPSLGFQRTAGIPELFGAIIISLSAAGMQRSRESLLCLYSRSCYFYRKGSEI
ncbi:hypothetical protein XENORESO_001264 [Xenotaenia resolanae]|uniref:Uncharacterized protein n=1 Tax=Xenotaenia resolanae TaxID=208358 RepID=A0ABV0VNP1_9TELE